MATGEPTSRSLDLEEWPCTDGAVKIDLSSWPEFITFIEENESFLDRYVWRGQRRDNWTLLPTLYRVMDQRNESIAYHIERGHMERFQYATRGRLSAAVRLMLQSDNDWWALGQHYGLATPLLDWTHSPYAAAYFAFFDEGPGQTDKRMVFALDRLSVEAACGQIPQRSRHLIFHEPLSDDNPRLVSQGGLFTRAPLGKTVEEWITEAFRGLNEKRRLICISVPDFDRMSSLRSLNKMNINHASLFPDLHGASGFCNSKLAIPGY
jgi:hypothetical protein